MQAEQVSKETNCWLFLGAQHPNANGDFIHYTSSQLRNEARADTNEMINLFNGTMSALICACCENAQVIAKKLAWEERLKKKAEEEAESSRQALNGLQAELEQKNALIAELSAKYNL